MKLSTWRRLGFSWWLMRIGWGLSLASTITFAVLCGIEFSQSTGR